MMADNTIVCPKCGNEIQLSEAFTVQIRNELSAEFEQSFKERAQEFKDALLAKDQELESELKKRQVEIQEAAQKKAEEAAETNLKDLKAQLQEKTAEIKQARDDELKLRKRERELIKKTEKAELEIVRRLTEERGTLKTEIESALREEHDLVIKEKDTQLDRVRKQLKEATRKAEGKSQELQGEALELELEELLRKTFPTDEIQAVKKGVRGADVIQRVRSRRGDDAGTILWESKRTKAWSATWIRKLKDDQRRENANFGVIVSEALPDTVTDFGSVDGIWVTGLRFAVGLATVVRQGLIDLAQARAALVDKSDKMDLLYNYLSGPQFKQRIEPIVESFIGMQEDLEREKRAMETAWAKREKQIQRALASAAGMYGDLQGIIGASLPPVKTLELPSGTE
ncbi:MAG: DUF2130 domain-containing protein [Chloroflexi bacterium]|nr:DUF2130 domain-containing protein [Chloroflexota bacterium]